MRSFIETHCSKEWQDFINHKKETIQVMKDEFIFEAGDDTKGLYIIDFGKVKITYRQFDGSERLVRLSSDGDWLGHRGFGGGWKYPISAIALEKTQVSFIPVEIFNIIAKTNPEFSYHLMMFFAEELRVSESGINHFPVKNLVAKSILDNYKAFGFEKDSTKLAYTLSRKDFANNAGTTYETVVRTFAEFNKNEIIKIEGKAIHILDINKLKELAVPELK